VKKKRILIVCPNSWDEAQLGAARPGLEHAYELLFHGEDAEHDPASFPLLSFVAEVVERYRGRIDGVASSSDYPGCLVAAAVAQELGLPGPAPEALLRCSHKYFSRVAQQESVREATPRFALLDPRRLDRHAPGLAFPCFVKPVKSWFSVLAQPVGSFEELQAFAARPDVQAHLSGFVAPLNQFMARYSSLTLNGSYLLAEELLHGDQVTLEGFVSGREVVVTGIVDSVMFPGTISFQRFDYPSRLDRAVQERMIEIGRRVMRHIGLDSSLFNVELFHDRATGRITIIEINPRMVGQFADLMEMVNGTNTYEVLLAVAAGERPAVRRARGRFEVAASFPLRAFEDRRVLRVPGAARLAEVRRRHPVSVVKVYCRPGHWLSEEGQSDGLTHRYGVVNMGGQRLESMLAEFAEVERELGFAFEALAPPGSRRRRGTTDQPVPPTG
jgi:biotin carboxylase